jgi:NTE family protein
MVFHAGALQQLNELGYLPRLDFVSSVSGGSLAAGVLALAWRDLRFDQATGRAANFDECVVGPLRDMARRDVDKPSVLGGLLTPRQRISDRVADAYREHLFGDATLQDLPDTPRFIFCATNLQTTSLVRFSKKYVADYRLGLALGLPVPLAVVVGASSAFPPFLSPATLRIPAEAWDRAIPQELAEGVRDPLVLTDGGVYDNLGLEPVIKRCTEILVSNGGGYVGHPARIPGDWLRHLQRVSGVVDHQVRSLRKRMLIEGYRRGDFAGAYWGLRSAVADYGLPDPLPFPEERARELAAIPTRLARMRDEDVEGLLRWGRVICDTAMRRWVVGTTLNPGASARAAGGTEEASP